MNMYDMYLVCMYVCPRHTQLTLFRLFLDINTAKQMHQANTENGHMYLQLMKVD